MARYTRTGSVNTVPAINAELEKIENAFEGMVSRKGDVPNQLEADIDMNGYSIFNVKTDSSNLNSLVRRGDTYLRSEIDNKDSNILEQANAYAESVAQGQAISQIQYIQDELPTGPILSGARWYKPSEATTYVYYIDEDGAQWVEEPVQSSEGSLRLEVGASDSKVLVGGVEASHLAKRVVDVKDYGAVGDGVTDDTVAIQAAIDANKVNGSPILFTAPSFLITQQLDVSDSVNLTLIGNRSKLVADFNSDERLIGGSDADGLYVENLALDQQYSVTGFGSHAVSLLNPRNNKFVTCDVVDFAGFGILMFTDDRGASGVAKNNHIIDCTADGRDVSYGGGFAMESMANSTITGSVTGIAGDTPGYAVNLKNNCTNCSSDVIISDSNAGLVLSDDGPSIQGNGVKTSFVKANVRNCKVGASFNKSSGIHADLNINGGGADSVVGLGIFGLNNNNDYDVSLVNCNPSGYAVTSRSDNQRINVRRYDMSADKLLLWEAGTDRNRLIVGFTNISGNGPNIVDFVDDDAGNLSNEVVYLRDAPAAINIGGNYSSNVVFPIKGAPVRTDYMISTNDITMTMRVNGVNMLSAETAANAVSPGDDNTLSLGRASKRWTEIFSVTGSINTSDDREKDYLTISQNEKSAAAEIKQNIRKFKFKDAVKEKGQGARSHFGVSAQQVKAIMESHGLDPFSYGILCYDEWEDGSRYGIRYEELLCFIMTSL